MELDYSLEQDINTAASNRTGMNTAKLKIFAQKARNMLMVGVERKVQYWGFDKKGAVVEEPMIVPGGYMFRGNPYDDATVPAKWKALRAAIARKGVKEVAEEAAYTWFNRLMAIRILAQNRYDLPQLEYAEGADLLPLLLQRARRGQYDFLNKAEQERLKQVLLDYERDTEAFGILLIGYCHSHTLLNNVFGGIDDYTELLLPDDILSESGFVHLLNTTDAITEEDYKQVELIGWLYQFYISEKKDEVFAGFKKNKKAEAADIPAATQIFTPNWIVKYMVQNTVGKQWLDYRPESPLKQDMRYLVEAPDQQYGDPIINNIEELKLLDPAAGSGHILVEGFDLLYAMYEEEYYQPEEAVESILKNNLFGLDIDKRAAQLSRFAILLKAASKYKDILKSGNLPRVYAMPEPSQFSRQEVLDFLGAEDIAYEEALTKALTLMQDAQNLGSIMQFSLKPQEREFIVKRFYELEQKSFREFSEEAVLPKIRPFIHVLELLTTKYEAVAANPPYMGQGSMNGKLKAYVDKKYASAKSDLMTVFIKSCEHFSIGNGLIGMITIQSWMFLSSFKKVREQVLIDNYVQSLIQIGYNSFPELNSKVAQCCSFIIQKAKCNNRMGIYYNLNDAPQSADKNLVFIDKSKKEEFYRKLQSDFFKVPDSPISFWIEESTINCFEIHAPLNQVASIKQGLATSDNARFRRDWQEVNFRKTSILTPQAKWFPYNSGGEYRKWYGNHYYLVNWEKDGMEIKACVDDKGKQRSRPQNVDFYFKESISWTKVTTRGLAFRYFPEGFIFDVAGCSVFTGDHNRLIFLCGLMNSALKKLFVDSISPTINYEVGQVSAFPVKEITKEILQEVNPIVEECISIAKQDWDNREYSWNFQINPLIAKSASSLQNAYNLFVSKIASDVSNLHKFEQDLNNAFINFYELEGELSYDVKPSDITIYLDELDLSRLSSLDPEFSIDYQKSIELLVQKSIVIKQLLSYTVGCFMGRYRLDKLGLQIAHPDPESEETAPYTISLPLHGGTKEVIFSIDEDAIVPLMGKSCRFTDDALQRTVQFIEYVWGEETLTQNLNFLQEGLDQDLEQYLVRDFWKDHLRTYNKKPIYWLFTSSTGAFQVLVYMHRMNRFTVTKIRDKYLLPHMQYLAQQIAALEGQGAALGRVEARQLDKLRKDLYECEQYDLLLKDKADQQIEFDLDNGVTANYELFKGVVAPIK
ncbi:BREX-1 system adenine-specific DNA-methyltransferase PglX [Rufibacter psychrotolerans]|uniref:BREX-1 system adenine-specific DNA-methyltransferase PglX n=1 Tax=Rufibacter psychrotolerans TaxID=2812556 RepID=UPI0019680DCC|nr:BREX-1 system adenine-specific DNA-methyltransferase PglX [Rufibacter sp. SYSU D00308]